MIMRKPLEIFFNSFQNESLSNSIKIHHKCSHSILNWKSPHGVLYGKTLNYKFLNVFGCLCYATNTKPHKDKFDLRAFKCIFIAYVPGCKAYKLFDLQSNNICISRDIILHENIFPFKEHTSFRYIFFICRIRIHSKISRYN